MQIIDKFHSFKYEIYAILLWNIAYLKIVKKKGTHIFDKIKKSKFAIAIAYVRPFFSHKIRFEENM